MTTQETRDVNMGIAQSGICRENDIRREAFDVVPRTLFCSGIVFLSLVVPLYFSQNNTTDAVRICFRVAAVSMLISLLCSGCLFERTIRVATAVIHILQQVARGTTEVDEVGVQIFRRWEWGVFIGMCVAYVVSVVALIVAMFCKN